MQVLIVHFLFLLASDVLTKKMLPSGIQTIGNINIANSSNIHIGNELNVEILANVAKTTTTNISKKDEEKHKLLRTQAKHNDMNNTSTSDDDDSEEDIGSDGFMNGWSMLILYNLNYFYKHIFFFSELRKDSYNFVQRKMWLAQRAMKECSALKKPIKFVSISEYL